MSNVRIGAPALTDRAFDGHRDGQRFAVAPFERSADAASEKNVGMIFNYLDELRGLALPRKR